MKPLCCAALCIPLAATHSLAQVTTSQYDNFRTGATLTETILTPQTINVNNSANWAPSRSTGRSTPNPSSCQPSKSRAKASAMCSS